MFPGSPTQCERALFKAVKSGELDTVEKLIRFYKCDPSFVNATYRDTGMLFYFEIDMATKKGVQEMLVP